MRRINNPAPQAYCQSDVLLAIQRERPKGGRLATTESAIRRWSGFVYVAFVVDCYSRAIVGWHAATMKDTALVTTALKMRCGGGITLTAASAIG